MTDNIEKLYAQVADTAKKMVDRNQASKELSEWSLMRDLRLALVELDMAKEAAK